MFYANKQAIALASDLLLESADVYIQRYEFEGSGVINITVPATSTLTPAVAPSPAWTVNGFASTVGKNLYYLDDNGAIVESKIISNTATAITFNSATSTLVSDGATAPTLTGGATYQFYILTGSASYEYGDFFGYTGEVNITPEDENAELKVSVPRKLVAEGLLERTITIEGINYNVPSTDLLRSLLNMTPRGLQTGQTELHTGFNPEEKKRFKMTFRGKTHPEGRAFTVQAFKGQFTPSGALPFSEEGFKSLPWSYKVLSDNLRPEQYDALMVRIAA